MVIEKIDIQLIDFEHEKIIECRECSIELTEKYVKYKLNYLSNRPTNKDDISLGSKEFEENLESVVLKDKICGVEKVWVPSNKHWQVIINAIDIPVLRMPFKMEYQAKELFEKIINWLINGN